ncbi:peptidoglycan-binding protein [Rhodopseudomonas palustris]|uniref:Peptidoglycan-binding protein n=2 Tax=Rhodopseudomonas palustris TaxID=1076 RepID=A0A418VE65_RHOPL|nr:peptidoglycan-binding protein [Rhodopseudomonas palustris]
MRLLMSSPRDVVAGMFASAAVVAIITNAIFMQAGQHPSPMFGRSAASASISVVTLPRPRPAEPRQESKTLDPALLEPSPTELKPSESKTADAKPTESRAAEPKHVDSKPDTRRVDRTRTADADAGDPLGSLVQRTTQPRAAAPAPAAASSTASNAPRPPAAIPAAASRDQVGDMISSSRRIAAVQRALTEYGYGQLKPTGNVGSDTQAAIQRFERARRMPVTGQVSDRLVRELGMVTGRAID